MSTQQVEFDPRSLYRAKNSNQINTADTTSASKGASKGLAMATSIFGKTF